MTFGVCFCGGFAVGILREFRITANDISNIFLDMRKERFQMSVYVDRYRFEIYVAKRHIHVNLIIVHVFEM